MGYVENAQTLGDHIRNRRLELGLLQSEVAERIGVHEATIYLWEKNKAMPHLQVIPSIHAFLGHNPHPQENMSIGEKLVFFRSSHGWPRPKLAKVLNVDPSTLARWENGKRMPWGQYVERIQSLGIPMNDIEL